MKKINILTIIFSVTILLGFWTIQSDTNTHLFVQSTHAQEDFPSTVDEPSTIIDEPSVVIDEPSIIDEPSTDNQCTIPTKVCCNPYGNHIGRPLGECEECDDSVCDFPSTEEPSASDPEYPSASNPEYPSASNPPEYPSASDYKTKVCCEPGNKNYIEKLGKNETCGGTCEACEQYICCNADAENYVGVQNRPSGKDNCAPPYTTCRTDTPTCVFKPCDPNTDIGCGSTCSAVATCTISNGSVSINGQGASSFPADSGCTPALATAEAEAACSSLTPDMPIGSTIAYGSFAVALVTGRDVCSNLSGDQDSIPTGYSRATDGTCKTTQNTCEEDGGIWIENDGVCIEILPECGYSAGKTGLNTPPTVGLCNPGTPSSVQSNTSTYNWTCADTSLGQYTVSCSAQKCTGAGCTGDTDLCNNIPGNQDSAYIADNNLSRTTDGECYQNGIDLCSNITGTQDVEYLDTHNLYRDMYGRCWDDNGGACGTAMNMLTWATRPQNNICDPSSTPTPVVTDNTNLKYTWNCLDQDGNTVGICSVNMLCSTNEKNCKGRCIPKTDVCLENATTTLIQTFKVVPRIVQKVTDTCTLSWTVQHDNPDPENPLTCNLNGVSLQNFNSSKEVHPGVQRIFCSLGEEYQEKAVRCEVNPEYKEV